MNHANTRLRAMHPKVLLDSNIWRYVVDAREQGRLIHAARHSSTRVQVAPAIVFEALRLRDISLRNQLIALMTNRAFDRMMPEAFSEIMEILAEIGRLRPQWLRKEPDTAFFDRSRKDWSRKTGGFWVRCADTPDLEAGYIAQSEGSTLKRAGEEIKNARKEMIEARWKANPPLDEIRAGLHYPLEGWNGELVEAWRLESLNGLTYALSRPGHPYRDWLSPFLELDTGLLKSAGWVEFWMHAADVKAVPRQWIRWGHAFAQRFRKVTAGSGGDNQLFSYLLDTDMVITADKGFVDILEACRPFSPCGLPVGRLVPGGHHGVEAMLGALEEINR